MSYYNQLVIAQYITACNITVIVTERLNYKNAWELKLIIPKDLWSVWDNNENFIYENKEWAYFAEDPTTGRVRYFSYHGEPGHGFGGHTYHLPMVDGSTATLIGPWASNSHAMNTIGMKPSKEVTIQGRYNMADAMTVEAINQLLLPLEMECIVVDGDPVIIRLS